MSEQEEFEIRLSWQEDAIASLHQEVALQNMTIADLQAQIKHLANELKLVRGEKHEAHDFDAQDEVPPHY